MSQKKYQHYQAVQGSWFTQIPTHWEMLSSNRVFEQKREPAVADDEQLSVTQKYGVMPQNLFMAIDDRKVTLALAGTDNFKHVDEGDFVISLRSFEGGIELSQYKGCISPAYTCLRARKPLGEGYYKFTMKSKDFISALQSVTQGIRDGKNISYAEFSKLSIPYPPVEEQAAIARFLDRETAKIDDLIAEQQRLIELLQEKRQVDISHAVTKGLNPNAPMKDSGVEWLGDVPVHWAVKKIKHLARSISKGTTPSTIGAEFTESGIRFLKAENITPNGIQVNPEFFISSETHATLSRSALFGNEVLVVIAGATTGKSAVLHQDTCPANTNQAVSFIRTGNQSISHWISIWLSLDAIQRRIALDSVQSAQPNLSMEDLGNLPIAVPAGEEMLEIVSSCNTQIDTAQSSILESQKLIDLMAERRSALISAAVTGQIDVRELIEVEAGEQ